MEFSVTLQRETAKSVCEAGKQQKVIFQRCMTFINMLQDWDARLAGSEVGLDAATLSALSTEAGEWRTIQDGQRILTTTPSVLGGCRAQVYRAAGATQWYTAVIVGVNEHTGVS